MDINVTLQTLFEQINELQQNKIMTTLQNIWLMTQVQNLNGRTNELETTYQRLTTENAQLTTENAQLIENSRQQNENMRRMMERMDQLTQRIEQLEGLDRNQKRCDECNELHNLTDAMMTPTCVTRR